MIQNTKYKILSIDTSCDETSAAVTDGTTILSNIVWSQASQHAKFGGVMPSLAQRMHEEHIDYVVNKAMLNAKCQMINIDAIAVTSGPGLAIALGVGIAKAKELARNNKKPLVAINHMEGHVLSCLARPNGSLLTVNRLPISFPALGLVVSGKNTLLVEIEEIGKYKTLATIVDDALGEALDKAARMLGLGYPGGAILEKMAREGDPKSYPLPVPLSGQEYRKIFSYSGLKTAMYMLVGSEKVKSGGILKKEQIENLAASFQKVAFEHLMRVLRFILANNYSLMPSALLVGGGVIANLELRKRLRGLCKEFKITVRFPYTKRLIEDNAAMIGIAAFYKLTRNVKQNDFDKVDRESQAKIDMPFKWEYNNENSANN